MNRSEGMNQSDFEEEVGRVRESIERDLPREAEWFSQLGIHMTPEECIQFVTSEKETIEKELAENNYTARLARKVIKAEIDRLHASWSPFDVGRSCGLSFALGAFSGVCEDDVE